MKLVIVDFAALYQCFLEDLEVAHSCKQLANIKLLVETVSATLINSHEAFIAAAPAYATCENTEEIRNA